MATTSAAADSDAAAVAFDDGFGDGQAEAGSVLFFSGEEGIEDFVEHDLGDAMAVVGYGDVDLMGALADPEAEGAIVRQRVYCVADEVREDLENFAGVSFDDGVRGEVGDDMDLLVGDAALMDAEGGLGYGDDVGGEACGGRAVEAEGLPRDADEV